MRALSLMLVGAAITTLPACLLLRHHGDDGAEPGDTDTPSVLDTDASDTDRLPTDDSPTDTDDGNTDVPVGDTDAVGDTDLGVDTDPSTADSDSTPADSDPRQETADSSIVAPGNHPPTVTGVAVSPSELVFNDILLVCTSDPASDPDGNLTGTTLNWRNVTRGVDLGQSATLQLVPLLALPGDILRCTVTAHDTLGATQPSANA